MSDKSIWATLSAIDCREHTEKKGQFSYLAWTWAWAMVKENYPWAEYELLSDTVYPDGTMEVRVRVSINTQVAVDSGNDYSLVFNTLTHTMWLPVLDFKNKAIQNPNAFDINSSRMRCLVKCLAMFGLGHYIYAGESAPQAPDFTAEQKEQFVQLMADGDSWGLKRFTQVAGNDVMTSLFNDAPKGQVTKQKTIARDLIKTANDELKATLEYIYDGIDDGSIDKVNEAMIDLTELQTKYVEAALNDVQKAQIENLRSEGA